MSNQPQKKKSETNKTVEPAGVESGWRRWVPWVLVGVFGLNIIWGLRPAKSEPKSYDVAGFGKLPVMLGGRVKPLDSVARNSLRLIAGKTTIALDGNGPRGAWGDLEKLHGEHNGKGLYYRKFYQFGKRPRKLHPTEWLMEVLMKPEQADRRFIFRIDHPELLDELDLSQVGVDQSGLRYYSFEQLWAKYSKLVRQSEKIRGKKAEERSPYDKAVSKLTSSIHSYIQLRHSLQPNPLEMSLPDGHNLPREQQERLKIEKARNQLNALFCQEIIKDYARELERMEKGVPLIAELKGISQRGAEALERASMVLVMEAHQLADPEKRDEWIQTSLDRIFSLMVGAGAIADSEVGDMTTLLKEATPEQRHELIRYLVLTRPVYELMGHRANVLLLPPDKPQKNNEGWEKTGTVLFRNIERGAIPKSARHYAAISSAYVAKDPAAFNTAVGDYQQWLQEHGFTAELKKGSDEHYFNSYAPFARSMGIYLVALLLACFSWLSLSRWLSNSAFYLVGLAFVVHTSGLIFRMYLEGRPPVTNLYSSAIFMGWGAVLLGWVLERIYRNGIGSVTAGGIGFATLIIAHQLSLDPNGSGKGDTMEMMQAVLDTNFWLATHVTSITIGYSATFLSGFLALLYVLRGTFTRSLDEKVAKSLSRMVYGIVCFATITSFVGTVLGGIWADQSWGRFWGWDTKENGALLIVIWNALILHAKWGGLIRDRGLMNLAIFGNVVTAWSWFGVNSLGVGLHAYGHSDAAFATLKWFAFSQFVIIMVGCVPLQFWASGKYLTDKTGKAA